MAGSTLPYLPWREPVLESGPVLLNARRLYILPTRSGLVFALLMLGLLLGAINYGISLVYLFTFWFSGLAIVAMLHTQRNLAGLILRPAASTPVFAGETACFQLHVDNPSPLMRQRIGLQHALGQGVLEDIPANGARVLGLPLTQSERGWHIPGRFALYSEFPLGLFRCWSVLELDWGVLVYPKPAPDALPFPLSGDDEEADAEAHAHGEGMEFAGLRNYQPGDTTRRIAWKASARGGGDLLTKEFSGNRGRSLWLSWWQTPEREVESRLSRLTRWVLDAHAGGLAYGLKLPGHTFTPKTGEIHLRQCLEALARHGQR